MTNQQIWDSPAYKTYLAFATGADTPKKAWKFKKPVSPSKKKTLVAIEKPAEKPAKKLATRRQSARVQICDTPGVFVSKKKAPAKTERSKRIKLLSDAALLEEAQLKKAIKRSKRETHIHEAGGSSEGANLESEVPDEPKGKSIDISEGTSLKPGVPDQSDDERIESDDDDKTVDINKTDDEEEDEFGHTCDDYVPTDDENVDDEEFERINKEMYSDVNVELKDSEHESEGKDDEEMTDVGQVDVEQEEVSQEVAGDQVKDDAQEIVTAALATQKTEVPLQSSSISSDYATKFLNFDNIPSEATTSTTAVPDSETFSAIHQRLSDVENEAKTLINVDHGSTIRAAVKSEVPIVVKEYLGTSLDNSLYKALQRHTAELVKEHSLPADVTDVLQQQLKPQKVLLLLARSRWNKQGNSKSINIQSEDTGNTDEPPIVKVDPNDWFKKPERPPTPDPDWNEGKSVKNKPTQKWLSDLAKAEKPSKTFDDLMSTPIDFSAFVMNRLQISDLIQDILVGPAYELLKGTCRSYVELDYNMEECYKALTDQLDWNNPEGDRYPFDLRKPLPLEKALTDKVPNLWSPIKVAYDKHALLVTNVKVNIWYGYGHLEEIEVRRSDKKLYKFKEGDFPRLHLNDIEDMLLLVVQNRLFNLEGDVIVHFAAVLRMFTRRIVIQKRVEDLQLGVESYQKKLNISKPRTREEDLSQRSPYTTLSDPQGVIYEDKLNRKRLMRSDELYKFSNGTL
ncbi:hypothetical protein Tco_0537000 [Tanacetum coccineum]